MFVVLWQVLLHACLCHFLHLAGRLTPVLTCLPTYFLQYLALPSIVCTCLSAAAAGAACRNHIPQVRGLPRPAAAARASPYTARLSGHLCMQVAEGDTGAP